MTLLNAEQRLAALPRTRSAERLEASRLKTAEHDRLDLTPEERLSGAGIIPRDEQSIERCDGACRTCDVYDGLGLHHYPGDKHVPDHIAVEHDS